MLKFQQLKSKVFVCDNLKHLQQDQLSLQDLLTRCPYPVNFMRNKPLIKLTKEYNLKYSDTLPTSRPIGRYPNEEFVVGMSYKHPKIFFDAFRVWSWTSWANRNTQGVPGADYMMSFSPCSVANKHIEACKWGIEIFEKVKELLDQQ